MKKVLVLSFLLTSILLAAIGCNKTPTAQELAEKAVKDYLMTNLNDPSSYESVEFSPVDTIFTKFEQSDFYKEINRDLNEIKESKKLSEDKEFMAHLLKTKGKVFVDSLQLFIDREPALLQSLDSAESAFTPEPKHLIIAHTFRAKNGFGALNLDQMYFYIDMDYKVYKTKSMK